MFWKKESEEPLFMINVFIFATNLEKTKNYTQSDSSELVHACMSIAMHTCRSLESTREMHRNVRVDREMNKGKGRQPV